MMDGQTMTWFIWKNGLPFTTLSKSVFEWLALNRLQLEKWPNGRGLGVFKVAARSRHYYSDAPWEKDPWPEEDTNYIFWHVRDNDGLQWGNFYVKREQNLPYFPEGQIPDKVHVMLLFFEGRLWAHQGETEAQFEELVGKYNCLKNLFKTLDCDEVIAWDEYYIYDYAWQAKYPQHRDKMFRFAKEGTQVLVKRLEERQMLLSVDWLNSRIFIDPPDVSALTPEEYEKLSK